MEVQHAFSVFWQIMDFSLQESTERLLTNADNSGFLHYAQKEEGTLMGSLLFLCLLINAYSERNDCTPNAVSSAIRTSCHVPFLHQDAVRHFHRICFPSAVLVTYPPDDL